MHLYISKYQDLKNLQQQFDECTFEQPCAFHAILKARVYSMSSYKCYLRGPASPTVLCSGLQLLHQRDRKREGLPRAGPRLTDHILPIIHRVKGLHLDVEEIRNTPG